MRTTTTLSRSRGRSARGKLHRRIAGALALGIALLSAGALYTVFAPQPQTAIAQDDSQLVAQGQQVFDNHCISCHGANLQGVTDRGPSLIGVGSAATYFQVSSGRMPLARQEAQGERKKPLYTREQAQQIGAYIQSLGGGPELPNQTDAQLKRSQKLLISKKHLVRMIWSSETEMDNAFASGDIWIALAWPNDWVQMRKKKLKVVYMHPKEKPIAWVGMFMLLKGTSRPHLAHAYVNAWSSKRSAKWLEDNYGYGHANKLARPSSSDLLRALQLTNPRAVTLPNAYLDRDVPRRALYAKLWEEVKAS